MSDTGVGFSDLDDIERWDVRALFPADRRTSARDF